MCFSRSPVASWDAFRSSTNTPEEATIYRVLLLSTCARVFLASLRLFRNVKNSGDLKVWEPLKMLWVWKCYILHTTFLKSLQNPVSYAFLFPYCRWETEASKWLNKGMLMALRSASKTKGSPISHLSFLAIITPTCSSLTDGDWKALPIASVHSFPKTHIGVHLKKCRQQILQEGELAYIRRYRGTTPPWEQEWWSWG